jgi:hypothetical protein
LEAGRCYYTFLCPEQMKKYVLTLFADNEEDIKMLDNKKNDS